MKSAIYISVFALVAFIATASAQTKPNEQTVKWQTYASKSEFSVAMPAGTTGFSEDKDYFMGKSRSVVKKRVFLYRSINGAVLLNEMIEGDVKGVRDELISQLGRTKPGFELAKSQTLDGISMDLYTRKKDRLSSMQQFVLFKNRLYVLQAHSIDENNPIVANFFRSLAINIGNKTSMPNVSPTDDLKAALNPSDVVENALDAITDPPVSKPDRDAMVLYKPRPQYSADVRRAGITGEIVLNVLLSAKGKVEKVEFKSGQIAFREGATAAASNVLFIPAEKDGHPVSVWKMFSYSFLIY